MILQEFIDKYNGQQVDFDGAYGTQCWDLAAKYARDVCGCPDLPTGNFTALGVYTNFLDPLPQYFDRVANNDDPNHYPPVGALVIFNWSTDGHIAIVAQSDMWNMTDFEEDGSIDTNGDGKADGTAYLISRSYANVIGWLVPKKDVVNAPKPVPILTTKDVTNTVVLSYKTIFQDDNTLPKGQVKTLVVGVDGYTTTTTRIYYSDGIETGREQLVQTTTPAIDQVVLNGTYIDPEPSQPVDPIDEPTEPTTPVITPPTTSDDNWLVKLFRLLLDLFKSIIKK